MTKQDLKTGMLVQCANGNVYLVINIDFVREEGRMQMSSFTNTLESFHDEDFEIIKVSKVLNGINLNLFNWTEEIIDKYLLWSREDGFVESKISDKPLRKEEFDIESGVWIEID